MIRLEEVTLTVGGRDLMSGVNLHLRPGERLGLVGRNGTGKTTILRAITGALDPSEGRVHRRGGLTVGELPQDAVSGSDRPLWEEARSGLTELLALEDRLHRSVEAMDGTHESIEAHAKAEDAFRRAGGYAMEEKIGVVLHGLGFTREDWGRSCAEFSGGWQMRIALARLLLSEPDVLLLDEPTNHLDLHSRSWLGAFLAEWKGAVVLVSHDRYVLDRCTTAIAEVRGGALTRFTGNFSRFLELRELKDREQIAARERYEAERSKALDAVARFGAKATKARQAHSRLARVERMEAPEEIARESRPRLTLKAPEGGPELVISLRGVSAGWDAPLFEGLNLELHRGERWFLLGPNGVGKSTLVRVLAGALKPLAGRRAPAARARIGWYEQDQAQALPPEATGLSHLLEQDPFCPESRARAALGALGLSGDRALQPIHTLSGGEKARVALAALALKPWELLLLDEPTNHLDAVTVDVLAGALADWPGALVVITHDRFLVERLATHVVSFQDGELEIHPGVRPEDLEARRGRTGTASEPAEKDSGDGAGDYKARKRRQREIERLGKRVEQVEAEIARLEERLEALDGELEREAADPARVEAILADRVRVDAALEEAMLTWESESAALEQAKI
jgi:ATP-binding cassette subfamily F protein 3